VKAWSLGDPYGWRFALGHSNRVRPNTAYDVPVTNVMPIINFKTHTPAAMQYLPFPMRVPGVTNIVSLSLGSEHVLALTGLTTATSILNTAR
jgi:hypothetical protein